MTLTRRDFTRLIASGAAVGLGMPRWPLAAAPLRQQTFFTWRAIGTRLHAVTGGGGNVVLFRDGGQALLADAKNPGYGLTLRREAEAQGTPLTYVVITHHHSDHVGGNHAFTPDIPLLAHPTVRTRLTTWAAGIVGEQNQPLANALRQLRENNGNPALIADMERIQEQLRTMPVERFLPTRDVRDGEELRIGGQTVVLRHVGPGHTDNDVFLHFPQENAIYSGDLCFNGTHGFMDQQGGVSSMGWQRSVQAMLALANAETVVVPGHGDVTNRAGLQRQYDYFSQLRDAVSEAVRQGMTKEQVMQLQPPALADIMGNPSRNLGVVYDEVTGA